MAPIAAEHPQEVFAPELLAAIPREAGRDPIFPTVATRKPNRDCDVTPTGIWVETESSAAKGGPAQEIPAWMFQLAADHLEAQGSLTNACLLSSNGLNVKRSSAVCAILSRLPWVDVASRRPVELVVSEGL